MNQEYWENKLRDLSLNEQPCLKKQTVVFIVPPSPQQPTPGREFLITGPFEGFTYVATLIKKMGFHLQVLDCRLKENPVAYVLQNIKEASALGIATYCDSYLFLEELTAGLKEKFPKLPIFLGGPLVTSLPELLLSKTQADFAVLGEAELTLIEVFEELFKDDWQQKMTRIAGLAYKNSKNEIVLTEAREQIKNLDHLPLLDYSIWPNYESILKNGQILISSTRGCPHSCAFCFKTIPCVRSKSLSRFEYEVATLKKQTGFNYTWLNDLNFNLGLERSLELTKILKKYEIRYHCFSRVHPVSEELMVALKNSGCLGIWFGIESCDQVVLDANRKATKVDQIDHALSLAEKAGLAARGLFIVGLENESEEALQKMLHFIKKGTFLPLVKYLVPFPGTHHYQRAKEMGIIKDEVKFLQMLSQRKIRDQDDEIINLTNVEESILRKYFHQIWDITREREQQECFRL